MDLSFGNKKEDAAWREGSVPQFKTPEEEIAYLRARVAQKEAGLPGAPEVIGRSASNNFRVFSS